MSPTRQPKAGDMRRLTINIPPDLYDEIKRETEEKDQSFSGLVVERLERLADLERDGQIPIGPGREQVGVSASEPSAREAEASDHAGHKIRTLPYGVFCDTCRVKIR